MRKCEVKTLGHYNTIVRVVTSAASFLVTFMCCANRSFYFQIVMGRRGAVEPRRSNWYCAVRFTC